MTTPSLASLRAGFWLLGLLALLLWSQLQAAPHAPKRLAPNQSCTQGSCHKEQTQFTHQHKDKQGKELCRSCHTPVRANRHKFKPATKGQANCIGCHKDWKPSHTKRKNWRFEHGPVAVGACHTCHNPHGSNQPHLLRRTQTELCTQCHSEMVGKQEGLHKAHEPVRKAQCLTCHESHGSQNRHLLRSNLVQQCLGCHTKIKNQLANVKTHHGAVLRGQQCMNCHTGHERRHKAMLQRADAKLCLGCHNQSVVMQGKKKLINIKKHLATHKFKHEPVRKGKCIACHSAHGSAHDKLFVKAFPSMLYAAFSSETYALCFSCHASEAITQKQTYQATKFRNGALNLHYVHVRRKKSRSCRFCHDPHATNRPHLIRDKVRFGGWNLHVGFKSQSRGGTCQTACHEPRTYNRKQPVSQGYERYKKLLTAPHLKKRTSPKP